MWWRIAIDQAKDEFGIPADLTSHIVERQKASEDSLLQDARKRPSNSNAPYTQEQHLKMIEESRGDRNGLIEARERAWAEETRKAHQSAERAQSILSGALPGATVQKAGSLARGDFFDKGHRTYDLDFHVEGIQTVASEGKSKIPAPPELVRARALAEKESGCHVDVFVTHEGKLWTLAGRSLSRMPGNFGKQRFHSMSGGPPVRGKPMSWDAFQSQFYKDIAYKQEREGL